MSKNRAEVPLRTVSDLARDLGISNQRLFYFVSRAQVEPVEIRGRRKLYDAAAQGRILFAFLDGQFNDAYFDVGNIPLRALRRLGAELGVLERMRAVSGIWLTDRGEAMAASAVASRQAAEARERARP